MIKFIAIAVVLTAWLGFGAGARAAEGDIRLAGGAVIPVPAPGFKWTVRKPEPGPTERLEIFTAAKEGSTSKMMLLADPTVQDTDEKRLETIAKAVVANMNSMKKQAFTDVKVTKPESTPPIADRVSFSVSGMTKSGTTRYHFFNTIVFGKKATYQFQAITRTEEEGQALIKVVDAMKE